MRSPRVIPLAFTMGLSLFGCGGGGGGSSLSAPPGGGGTSPQPTVSSTTPSSQAICVLPSTVVSIIFSQTLTAGSVRADNFTLRTAAGSPVAGTVASVNRTASFTPSGALAANTSYTATLVPDAVGGSTPTPYVWSFTTAAATTSGNFRVCWQAVSDARLTGYRVYYSTSSPVTTAAPNRVVGNVTTSEFTPAELGVSGQTIYIAVTANSGSPAEESALSTQAIVVIQ